MRRSDKTAENLTMQVAWRTPLAKLDALESSMNEWLSTESNRWFVPATSVTLQNIQFQKYLEFTMGIQHNANWQDWGMRLARKTAFHAAVQHYCRQLGIVGYEAAMPIVYREVEMDVVAPETTSGPGDDDGDDADANAEDSGKTVLGFMPPRRTSTVRARRNKSRKAAMRGGGVDT